MKRAFVLLTALLLVLTGCVDKVEAEVISVAEVCCPYEIKHQQDGVEISLRDGEKSGILWRVEVIPEDICQVTQKSEEEYTCRYLVSGKEEGASQVTFTAMQPDETVAFVLTLIVNVDPDGKATVSSYQHREREDISVDTDGLSYRWNVDVNGILNFSFINNEDSWSVQGDGEGVCILSNSMSTPSGCKFSAQGNAEGQTTILLVGEKTQRKIHVVIQADADGKLEVVSVQEQ